MFNPADWERKPRRAVSAGGGTGKAAERPQKQKYSQKAIERSLQRAEAERAKAEAEARRVFENDLKLKKRAAGADAGAACGGGGHGAGGSGSDSGSGANAGDGSDTHYAGGEAGRGFESKPSGAPPAAVASAAAGGSGEAGGSTAERGRRGGKRRGPRLRLVLPDALLPAAVSGAQLAAAVAEGELTGGPVAVPVSAGAVVMVRGGQGPAAAPDAAAADSGAAKREKVKFKPSPLLQDIVSSVEEQARNWPWLFTA